VSDERRIRLSDVPSVPAPAPTPEAQAFAVPIDEFIATATEAPAALIGTDADVLLPAHGLVILAGRGGRGKTTLAIDAAFHLASGRDWLDFPVLRPLHVLIIENEGPQEMFRRKLAAKRASWPHPITGAIHVHTLDWGAFNLNELEQHNALRCFLDAACIDLVIGDPLDSLGIEGVGSPEDTRQFLELLKRAGLFSTCAWWLLHHPRKERTSDELDEIAGAWGGRPDTALMLDVLKDDRARLSFPKVRWSSSGKRPAYILGFDRDTEGFTVLATEQETERDYLTEITERLAGGKALTVKQIAVASKGGVGCGEDVAKAVMTDHPDRFVLLTGDDAKAVGKPSTTKLWALAHEVQLPPVALVAPTAPGEEVRLLLQPATPLKVAGAAAAAPHSTRQGATEAVASGPLDADEVERLAEVAQQTLDAARGNGQPTDTDADIPF
jgi:AAA domain